LNQKSRSRDISSPKYLRAFIVKPTITNIVPSGEVGTSPAKKQIGLPSPIHADRTDVGFHFTQPKNTFFILTVKRNSAIVNLSSITPKESIKLQFGKEIYGRKDRNTTNKKPKHQRHEKNTGRFDPRKSPKTSATVVWTDNTQLHPSRGIQHRRYDLCWKTRCWRDSGCRSEREFNPTHRGFLAWYFNRSGDYGGTIPRSKESCTS